MHRAWTGAGFLFLHGMLRGMAGKQYFFLLLAKEFSKFAFSSAVGKLMKTSPLVNLYQPGNGQSYLNGSILPVGNTLIEPLLLHCFIFTGVGGNFLSTPSWKVVLHNPTNNFPGSSWTLKLKVK